MMNDSTQTFPATLEGLSTATQFLQSALDGAGCSEKVKTSMMVAMDEIASNIVYYSGSSEFTIELLPIENPSRLKLTFFDAGKPFDPLNEAAEPDVTLPLEKRDIGGLGLFMVKKMMDEVSYENVDGRNVLTLVKNF